MNLERITDAVPERLENVIYNPCTNAKDSVLDAEEEARNSVASSFLRFLFEVVAHIRQRTGQNLNDCINGFTDKAAQRLRQLVPAHTRHSPDKHFNEVLCHLIEVDAIHQIGQRVDSLRESVEETLDCTLHVAVTQRVGQLGGDDLANPIPVFALQPLLQLVIEAREAAGERLKHSRPVQLFQETTGQIQRHGKLLRQQPPEDVPVNLIDDAVDRLGQMLADIHPVHRVHGVVQRLDGGIHALADFCSPAGPINAVHQLIDFVAQQCAQLFPVSFLKCLFQLVRKVQHGAVNGDLLKHFGGVNGAIVFRVVRVLIVQNVQFIEAGQNRFRLFGRLGCFIEALCVVLLNSRRLGEGLCAGQRCDQHSNAGNRLGNQVDKRYQRRGCRPQDRVKCACEAVLQPVQRRHQGRNCSVCPAGILGKVFVAVHQRAAQLAHEGKQGAHAQTITQQRSDAAIEAGVRFLCPQRKAQHSRRTLAKHGYHAFQPADNAAFYGLSKPRKRGRAAVHFLRHAVELLFHGIEGRTQLVILRRISARRVRGSILFHLRCIRSILFQLLFGLFDAVLQILPLLRGFVDVHILVHGLFVEQFVQLFLSLCNLRLEPRIVLGRNANLAQLGHLIFQSGNRFTQWASLGVKGF